MVQWVFLTDFHISSIISENAILSRFNKFIMRPIGMYLFRNVNSTNRQTNGNASNFVDDLIEGEIFYRNQFSLRSDREHSHSSGVAAVLFFNQCISSLWRSVLGWLERWLNGSPSFNVCRWSDSTEIQRNVSGYWVDLFNSWGFCAGTLSLISFSSSAFINFFLHRSSFFLVHFLTGEQSPQCLQFSPYYQSLPYFSCQKVHTGCYSKIEQMTHANH